MRSFGCLTGLGFFLLVVLAGIPPAPGLVPAGQAARLGADLTPVGAERAGNASGTIPAWTGGLISGHPIAVLPFGSDRKLFSITSANLRSFADRLPEGALALFARYPDYRMDIYPAHRTAALPARIYTAIRRNAVQARAAPSGIGHGVAGAAGGIPFPIPQTGAEIIWNHLLAFWGNAREARLSNYVAPGDGTLQLASAWSEITDFPYYNEGATPDNFGGYYFKTRHIEDRTGQGYIAWQPIDSAQHDFMAWRSLPGEHRVRRGPALAYDTPDPEAEGYQAQDEYYLFFGGPDRYVFSLTGKREMFVPYNNNAVNAQNVREVAGPRHENPEALRYELHRVWVVDATLTPGAHHVSPHRRFYIDEDTWLAVYEEEWDERGRLWKFGHGTMVVLPQVPTVIIGSQFLYDLIAGAYVFSFVWDSRTDGLRITPPHDPSVFEPASLLSPH